MEKVFPRDIDQSSTQLQLPLGHMKSKRPQGLSGMRILSRYIAKDFLKLLSLWIISFFLIFFVVELLERINKIIVHKAPVYLILEYFLYTIPPFLSQTLPFATLLAALITLGVLARNNEVVAMKAHGISTYRIMIPLLVLAASVTAFILLCNETIVPYSARKADYVWSIKIKQEEERAFFKLNKIWYHGEDVIYNIRLLEPKQDPVPCPFCRDPFPCGCRPGKNGFNFYQFFDQGIFIHIGYAFELSQRAHSPKLLERIRLRFQLRSDKAEIPPPGLRS